MVDRLDRYTEQTLVHTGQNWDPQLSDVFFNQLDVRHPDVRLKIDTSTLGRVVGGVISEIEPVLLDVRPDAFLVLGDTNSCLAAIMAKRMHIPVFHMEAGNRCFDENVPEEINRRIIDHVADFHLCYTEHARRNLLAEGASARRVFVVGSPMREVLDYARPSINNSPVLEQLGVEPNRYILVSMHREENVDNPTHLELMLDGLTRIGRERGVPILVSTHPRLRDRLSRFTGDVDLSGVRFCEPFGYIDYNRLQLDALCVISDSGTISEEASILGFPAITIRNAMERPEALDAGGIILTGLEPEDVARAARIAINEHEKGEQVSVPPEYNVHDFSRRVARIVLGLSPLNQRWANLDRPAAT